MLIIIMGIDFVELERAKGKAEKGGWCWEGKRGILYKW